MKKNKIIWITILCLCLVLVFAACGARQQQQEQPLEQLQEQPPQQPAEQPEQPVEQSEQPEPGAPDDPERPLNTDMAVTLEGQQDSMAVRLWSVDAFSVYVPEEWEQDAEGAWGPEDNPALRFLVLSYEGQSGEEARAALLTAYPDYSFANTAEEVFTGHDAANSSTLSVKMVETDSACYAVCALYPDEAAEGYGIRLRMLADTFEVKQ